MPTPRYDRAAELAQIDRYLAETGPTICPSAFAWGVGAALPLAEEVQRIAMFKPPVDAWSFWLQRVVRALPDGGLDVRLGRAGLTAVRPRA